MLGQLLCVYHVLVHMFTKYFTSYKSDFENDVEDTVYHNSHTLATHYNVDHSQSQLFLGITNFL